MTFAAAIQDLQPLPASAVSPADIRETARQLDAAYQGLPIEALLDDAVHKLFPGKIALLSSFGTEAAVVLHYLAQVDKSVPVLFLETGKHFMETLMYRDILIDRFGFTDARSLEPAAADLAREDPAGDLWSKNPDRCCHLRKVIPLDTALREFDAWVTGRKRFQTSQRAALPFAEVADGRIKINPLARWSAPEINQAFKDFRLPRHPLFDDGFASIGCAPCTRRILEGEDSRAGRWSGSEKTECGIHFGFTDGEGI